MEKELNGQKYKVIHILRDGTVLDSIKGHMIGVNEKTETFYRMLANLDDEELARLERLDKERVKNESLRSVQD